MNKFSGTLIAALILFSLVFYLFYFETEEKGDEETGQRVFKSIGVGQITEIRLKYPSYGIVSRKEGDKWFIIKGSKSFPADGGAIPNLINDIIKMKIEKVISEDMDDWARYGLDEPRAEVAVETAEKYYRLMIGDESPVGSGIYARLHNNARVFLVEGTSVWGFLDKSEGDLRDRQVLSLQKDKVERVKFRTDYSSFEVEKVGDTWVGKNTPAYVRVDQSRMEEIVRTFSDLKVVGFEDDEPKGYEDYLGYGLDEPRAEVEIFEDSKSVHLLFGDEVGGNYYLKLASEESVYSVSEFIFNEIPDDLNDVRDRTVLGLDAEGVTGLEIERGSSRILLTKKQDGWKLEGDYQTGIDDSKIYRLLEEIVSLEVEEFVDDDPKNLSPYGLDKPTVRLVISEEGIKRTLLFGKEKGEEVYIKLAGGQSVYAVSGDILSSIPLFENEFFEGGL